MHGQIMHGQMSTGQLSINNITKRRATNIQIKALVSWYNQAMNCYTCPGEGGGAELQ